MKNLRYILLFLPFTVLAQNDSIQNSSALSGTENFNNQIDLDVEFLASEFIYKHRVGKKLFLGGGLGFGFNLFFSANKSSYFELGKVKLVLGRQFSKRIYVSEELGVSLVYGDAYKGLVYRVGIGFYYGTEKFMVGFKPAIMIPFNKDDILPKLKKGFIAIPIVSLKIPLKRW